MSDSPATALSCTQCGGELHPDEGQIFLTCPYCSATVYLDPTQVVFHWFLAPTLTAEQASSQLYQWMSGNQTVKDLDKKAQVTGQSFQYFPMWYYLLDLANREEVVLQLAAAISVTELSRINLPAGDLRPYDSSVETQAVAPSVPLPAAREWLAQKYPGAQIKQNSLVHVPIYTFNYAYRNQTYSAIIEAATGKVLANIYPAKAEAPYILAGGITALVYYSLACLALSGISIFTHMDSAMIALILGLIAAPFLLGLAIVVASKV